MKTDPVEDTLEQEFETVWIDAPVYIPTEDGESIAETIIHRVQARKSRNTGEIFLDGRALVELDKVKARHMGLLTPDQIKELRERLDMTQKEISKLFQIGSKTWTRWESGHERPSRSINLLLHSLWDGMVTVPYLQTMGNPALRQQPIEPVRTGPTRATFAFNPDDQACEEPLVSG
jgi:DNA-binding transcriptional regulator YiaG